MRPEVKIAKDYYQSNRRLMRIDEDVLAHAVKSLSTFEIAILVENTNSDENVRRYIFEKLYNRYNDAIRGYTLFYHEDGVLKVRLSANSSISEIVDDPSEYLTMKSATINRIKDIEYNPGYVMPVDALEHAKEVLNRIPIEGFDKDRQFVLAKE